MGKLPEQIRVENGPELLLFNDLIFGSSRIFMESDPAFPVGIAQQFVSVR